MYREERSWGRGQAPAVGELGGAAGAGPGVGGGWGGEAHATTPPPPPLPTELLLFMLVTLTLPPDFVFTPYLIAFRFGFSMRLLSFIIPCRPKI
jgi:hypothetical protein